MSNTGTDERNFRRVEDTGERAHIPANHVSTSGQETLEEIPGYTKCVGDCGTYTINSHLNEFGLCGDCLLADYRKLRAHSPAVQALGQQQ